MPHVTLVLAEGQSAPAAELAEMLRHELGLQGIATDLHVGPAPPRRLGHVSIVIDPREFLEHVGPAGLGDDATLRQTILVCRDAPHEPGDEAYLGALRGAGAVFDVDQRLVITHRRLGIAARALRPGYSTMHDHYDADAERPIDIMFIGAQSPRRLQHLRDAAEILSRHNCLIHLADDAPSSYLGEGRWPLLAQTKILVNLHRDEADRRLEWQRVMDAMHAGAVVVSEHSSGMEPLVAGSHLLVGAPDAVVDLAEMLVADPARLAAIRAAAYERLRGWLPFSMSVGVLRAAIVEVVSAPRGSDGSRTVAEALSRAASEVDDGAAVLRAELGGVREELAEIRGQLARLQRVRLGSDSARQAARAPVRNSAWTARRGRKVTVIAVARRAEARIEATLDSLARSRSRDFELVIVDAGAGDRALARWAAAHPRIPSCVIVLGDDPGRGAARNAALQYASGEHVLILDPGTGVRPAAVDIMSSTLDAVPDASFVYPIQSLDESHPDFLAAGGEPLASYLVWDPGRLSHGNFVQAPYLIRHSDLRRLGGFATGAASEGLEDYDLWTRAAAAGYRGQLVAQVLAFRTASSAHARLQRAAAEITAEV